MSACNCIGPQNGQPLCPCRMRYVEIRDGRYFLPAQDLGPVPGTENSREADALKRILAYSETLPRELGPFPHDKPKDTPK